MSNVTNTNAVRTPYSPAGKNVIRLPRWKLCRYFLASNYAPFTVLHAMKVMDAKSPANARASIEALLALGWARKTNPPTDCKLSPKDATSEWFELTTLGVQRIMDSGHAKGNVRPEPGSQKPLYMRTTTATMARAHAEAEAGALEHARHISVSSADLAVKDRPSTAPVLTISTPVGNIVIPAEAMRPVYDSLKAVFG